MIRRIRKEFSIILWPFVCAVMIAPASYMTYFLFDDKKLRSFFWVVQIILCFIMSSVSFGSEFEYNTMERLLSQPISRKRLWREKTVILFIGIEAIVFTFHIFFFRTLHLGFVRILLDVILPIQSAFLSSLCAGALMALYLKKTHTAFWASITATILVLIIWQFLISMGLSLLGMKSFLYEEKGQEYIHAILGGLPVFLWCITAYILARRKFMRLEV